ncbi:MAG TPA: hypothetical protein VMS22_08575 [Candidatus Eisenbacteria bacterium]|nr:hypothetical protein [Candidatus Eisenbacteria bacterium]
MIASDGELLRDALRPPDDAARRVDEPAVREAADRLQHLRASPGEPEGRRDALEGRQLHDGVFELPEPPVVRDRLLRIEKGAHEPCRLGEPRVAEAVVVAVRTDVLPLAGGEHEDRTPLREMLRRQELLREDRRAAADRFERALADAHPPRVPTEDAHERLERELRRELRVRPRAVAILGRPQPMRVLELELIAGPHVIETSRLERLRRLDHLLDRRIARRERAERERGGVQARHGGI